MPSSRTSPQASPRSSTRRSGATAQKEIIELLTEDHKRVKKAFRQFEKLDLESEAEAAQAIVEQVCADLEVHAALEEEIFYPAAREALDEGDLIDEALVEHETLKRLIADLKRLTPDDDKYAATFTVLGEYVKHHIGEEEGEIFPQLEKAKIDWQDLQQQMLQRRQQLAGASPADDDDESDDAAGEERSTGSRGGKSGGRRASGRTTAADEDSDAE